MMAVTTYHVFNPVQPEMESNCYTSYLEYKPKNAVHIRGIVILSI